ncbi:MAG: SLC13 family permease [Proteobacteria bacterium]|nr:SLC13 family permease [Pseudomonadota bacterium]
MTVANLPVRDDDDRVPIHVVEGIDGGEQVDTSRGPRVGWFDRIRLKYLAQATAALLIAVTGTVLYFLPVADPATETAIRGGAALLVFMGLWLVRATPDHLAAILFFGTIPALGLAPPEIVFSGFRAGALWLILAGFIIGGTIDATGLGARLANVMVVMWGRSYPAMVTGAVLVGAILVFIAPSAIARVFMLVPIFNSLSDRVGFERGSNGRSGLVLAAALGTLIPSYAVLPSTAPNLVMLGTAERIFGVNIGYNEYLIINFPVLAGLTIICLPILICHMLPAEARASAGLSEKSKITRNERTLFCILIMALAFWVTDFVHGISPAWIALFAAALCLAPGFGPGRKVPLADSVNLGLWLFIAAVIGAGAMVSYTGFGDYSGKWLVEVAQLTPGNKMRNFYAIVLIGMIVAVPATMLGAPAILTPLAYNLSIATGFPLETILMLQVPTWMFFVMPYQLPAILAVMALGGIRFGQCIRVLTMFTAFGVFVILPLQFLWLVTLGYI